MHLGPENAFTFIRSEKHHIADIAEASRNSRSFTDAMAAMAGSGAGVQPDGATGAELSAPEQMLSEIGCCNFWFSGCQSCKVSGSTVVLPLLT